MKILRVLLLLALLVGLLPQLVLAQDDMEEEPVEICGLEMDEEPELADEVSYGLLVKPTEGEELEVRAGTTSSSQVILEASDLTILEVTGGPTRVGQTSWWEVITTSEEEGWVAESNEIAVGTTLTEDVVVFTDGWCAHRPVRVAIMMFQPGSFIGASAWGVEFDLDPENLPEGSLTFLDGNIVPADSVNLTPEAAIGQDHTMFRIMMNFFLDFGTADWRANQFWFIYDGEPEEESTED